MTSAKVANEGLSDDLVCDYDQESPPSSDPLTFFLSRSRGG